MHTYLLRNHAQSNTVGQDAISDTQETRFLLASPQQSENIIVHLPVLVLEPVLRQNHIDLVPLHGTVLVLTQSHRCPNGGAEMQVPEMCAVEPQVKEV